MCRAILCFANLLLPLGRLAIELFLNCDVGHGGGRRGTVPMLFVGSNRDHVTWTNFLDWSAPALHVTAARRHNERLTQWMTVPRGSCARFERHTGAGCSGRLLGLKQIIDADGAG